MSQKLLQGLTLVAASVGVACWLTPALAKPPFLKAVKSHYNLDEKFGKCTICHDVKEKEKPNDHNLNVAGKAFNKNVDLKLISKEKPSEKDIEALKTAFAKFEVLDSDGDGATNGEELALGTLPGDAKSTPAKDMLEKYRKEHPAVKKDEKKETQ